ncbi:UNVERIFIED_CONTAM: hypothetical protein RMT77_015921 [Armadillidium vulgare]
MMQVSTIYAHSIERQFVSRRSQILHNLSLYSVEQQQHQQVNTQPMSATTDERKDEIFLTEAGIIPPELCDDTSHNKCETFNNSNINNSNNNNNNNIIQPASKEAKPVYDVDSKEFTDRLCKLPSQCKGGYILGSPRRHPGSINQSATRLCQSAGQLNISSEISLMKTQNGKKPVMNENTVKSGTTHSLMINKKVGSKAKKEKKEAKKLPSNFMYLGTWSTRQNSEKLLEQVRSGDVLEFNIKFHHHWGIALVNKNKKPTLENLELIHLKRDKDGHQRAIKETLAAYWVEGVTARINNSRDVHKQPLCAADVISTSLKVVQQPYRIWQNSEQLITHCRYGEGIRTRPLSDAARWGTLSKCVGMWLNSLTSSRNSSPATSPAVRRKRTLSVNF